MTKRDLEDLSSFDNFQILLIGAGQFFLSGSIWLGVEKMIEAQTRNPFHDGVTTLCAAIAAAGAVLLTFGYLAWRVKRGKLASIYDEAS